MADDYLDQTAQNALDENLQGIELEGYGIISGGDASAAGGFDVTITQTTAFFAGATATSDATNKSLQQYVADEPRKVLICINQTGTITVEPGDPEPRDPPDEIRGNANRPAPPDLAGRTDIIPLWEVWIGASTTNIDDNDIFHDRRPTPDIRVRELVAAGVTTDTLIDGANVAHESELADLADVRTNADIEAVINDDPDHGSRTAGVGASHDFWTASDTLQTVNDEAELTVDITGDANTVDGYHARDFAEVGHNHDNRYLNDDTGTVAETNLNFDPFTYSEYLQTLGEVVATSSETLTGGSNPALRTMLQETTAVSDANLDVEVQVPSQPGFAADYGFSSQFAQVWDDSSAAWDVEVTVSWDTDPGTGNDVPVAVDVIERGDRTEPLPQGADPNDHINPTYDSNEDGVIDADVNNTTTTSDVVNSQELSGTHYPAPGDVQAALDAAQSDGSGMVKLRPNVDYDPTTTWDVWPDVTLDYNGATVVPTTDHDLINVHPTATILQARNHLNSVTFTSSAFVFDTAFTGDYFRDGITQIRGGYTLGNFNDSTVFYLYQNNGEALSNVRVFHNSVDCDVTCDLHSPDATGYINGNWFSGLWSDDRIGIHTHGGDTNGNIFDVILEPGSFSEVGWELETGEFNKLRGYIWDAHTYNIAPWRIGTNAGEYNIMHAIASGATIVNNTIDNLGSPMNNVVTGTKFTPVAQSASNLPADSIAGTAVYVQDEDRHYYWRNQ